MENAIGTIMGPAYLVLGLSLLFYANSWIKVFKLWQENHYLLIPMRVITLVLGLLVINLYNIWQWNIWLIVTLTGWIMLLKSVLYFLLPGDWLKICLGKIQNVNLVYFMSLVAIVVGAALSYYVYIA